MEAFRLVFNKNVTEGELDMILTEFMKFFLLAETAQTTSFRLC